MSAATGNVNASGKRRAGGSSDAFITIKIMKSTERVEKGEMLWHYAKSLAAVMTHCTWGIRNPWAFLLFWLWECISRECSNWIKWIVGGVCTIQSNEFPFVSFRFDAYERERIVHLFGFQLNNGFFTCIRAEVGSEHASALVNNSISMAFYSETIMQASTNLIENITPRTNNEQSKWTNNKKMKKTTELKSVQRWMVTVEEKTPVIYHLSNHSPAPSSSSSSATLKKITGKSCLRVLKSCIVCVKHMHTYGADNDTHTHCSCHW